MNYALLEDEIVARLAPIVTAGHEVEAMPSTQALDTSIQHKGRITVQVGAAKGDTADIQSQSQTSDQYEDVFVEIILRSKRLRSNGGFAGIYELSELARQLLQGWRSSQSWMPMEYVDLTPLSPDVITDGIFTWSLRMKTTAFLPAQIDADLSVLISQITILPDSETGPLAPFGEIFASEYSVLASGDQITIAWMSENGYTIGINGVGSDLEASGSATVTVTADTTYTLTVTRGATVFEVSIDVTIGTSCADVTEQINGTTVGATVSGGTNNQEIVDTAGDPVGTAANPSIIGDATVENSDASYSATVKAEGGLILPNTQISANGDLVVNQPSTIAKDITVRYETQGVVLTTIVSGDIVVPDVQPVGELSIEVYEDAGLTIPLVGNVDLKQTIYIHLAVTGITPTTYRFFVCDNGESFELTEQASSTLAFVVSSFENVMIFGEAFNATDITAALSVTSIPVNDDALALAYIAKHETLASASIDTHIKDRLNYLYGRLRGVGTPNGTDIITWSASNADNWTYIMCPTTSSTAHVAAMPINIFDPNDVGTIENFISADATVTGLKGRIGARIRTGHYQQDFAQNSVAIHIRMNTYSTVNRFVVGASDSSTPNGVGACTLGIEFRTGSISRGFLNNDINNITGASIDNSVNGFQFFNTMAMQRTAALVQDVWYKALKILTTTFGSTTPTSNNELWAMGLNGNGTGFYMENAVVNNIGITDAMSDNMMKDFQFAIGEFNSTVITGGR